MNKDTKLYTVFQALVFVVMLFLSSCGSSSDSTSDNPSDTGSIAFSIEGSTGEAVRAEAAPSIDCTATGIVTVEAEVYDENNNLIATGGPWQCAAGEGTIYNVTKGINRTVTLYGKDVSGAETHLGSRVGVTVIGDRTNDIGTIILNRINSEERLTALDDQAVVSWGKSVDVLTSGNTSVLWNDIDADSHALAVDTTPVSAPRYGTLTLDADGTFLYTHDGRSASETDSFTYSISDGHGGTATATVSITIADQYYVAPAPIGNDANDGSSSSPFATIGRAVDVAHGSAEEPVIIHIARGTYSENVSLDPWEFIEGGWNQEFTQRWDFANEGLLPTGDYQTVIDGGNTGRCITVEADTASIDGITVRNGTPPSADTGGGGIAVITCSPSIRNCRIEGNSTLAAASSHGGGMFIKLGSPRITHCTFMGNASSGSESGCNYGGGLYNYQSYPVITDCSFADNSAGNTTGEGGAMFNYQSAPVIQRCTFTGNTAGGDYALGGAIFNHTSSPVVTNCIFMNNSASGAVWGKGGAVYSQAGSPVVTNCTFTLNRAHSPGGYAKAGAVFNDPSATSTITNCILWENAAPIYTEIYCGSECTVTFSDIRQSGYESDTEHHNMNLNPRFIDPAGGDVRLQGGSPCVDAGSNSAPALPEKDFLGEDRIIGASADMGAFERQGD